MLGDGHTIMSFLHAWTIELKEWHSFIRYDNKLLIFHTEMFMRKLDLWSFFMSEKKIIHKLTIQVKWFFG